MLDLVTRLRDRGIKVTEIPKWGSYLQYRWEQAFASHLNRSEKEAIYLYDEGKIFMNGVEEATILGALHETLSLTNYPSSHAAIHEEEVYLLCLFADDRVVESYRQMFPHLTFKRWHPYILNVFEKEVSKSVAIKEVLAFFNVQPHEAIAFGDGDNVGLGIAMGNGSDGVKAIADHVTSCASEGGVCEALQNYMMI